MNRYEISGIFDQADTDHSGKINQKEWNDFYISFITHFENSDSEPRDGVLVEKEVETSLEDITVPALFRNLKKKCSMLPTEKNTYMKSWRP